MRYRLFSFLFAIVLLPISSYSQSRFDVYDYWKKMQDPSTMMYQQLLELAAEKGIEREREIGALSKASDWEARRKSVNEKLDRLVGALPERTPLEPVVTGIIQKDRYTIEKLHFQSQPGYYVTSALFIPRGLDKPAPAIVFCSGHSGDGFRSPTYQHMILNYVQKGFVVLAFDPIGQGERFQYFDENGETYLGPTKEHSAGGNQVFINGLSPANYFIWDGIRAIDYLETRSEVDMARIGVTGRSGGGTQTAYIMAFDDRVTAAAPECYMTTYDKLLHSNGPQDAEQIIKYFLHEGLDLADLITARAPKPTLMVTTTRDMFSIQGARDTYDEAAVGYALLNHRDNIQMVEDDAPHMSTRKNREATYAFFRKHLQLPGSSEDEAVDTMSLEELWVTPHGSVAKDLQSETIFSLNKVVASVLEDERNKVRQTGSYWSDLKNDVASLIGTDPMKDSPDVIYSGSTQDDDFSYDKYLVEGRKGHHMPLVWLKPTNPTGNLILILDDQGKSNQADSMSMALQLVRAGHQVVLVDVSSVGELGGGYEGGDAVLQGVPINVWYAGILLNKSAVGVHVDELSNVVKFIKEKENAARIDLIATGTLCADALHAQAILGAFGSMVLLEPLISYESVLDHEKYQAKYIPSAVAGSHPLYDLPHLTHYAPNDLLMINVQNAIGETEEEGRVSALYSKYRGGKDLKLITASSKEAVKVNVVKWIGDLK